MPTLGASPAAVPQRSVIAAATPTLWGSGDEDDADTKSAVHNDTDALQWSEHEVVLLHWRLLQEIEALADPETPLEAKFDTLRWVFTEREKDALPFSFVNCLRVVGCSPLSPIAYCGSVDAEEVRDCIRAGVRRWLTATLDRYPDWVREAVARNPVWIESQLIRNPQWLNEQVRAVVASQGELFA